MIKYVIFDFDGTVADSKELAFDLLNELSDKYGFRKITRTEANALMLLSMKERLKSLHVPLVQLPFMVMELKKNYAKILPFIKPFKGIKEVLLSLKRQNIKTVVISSNSVENIKKFLVKHEMNSFETIHSQSNIFGKHRSIKALLSQQKIGLQEVIYIGDEHRDIEACKKAKIKIISVKWGLDPVALLRKANPDYMIDAPADILKVIASLNA
ncbi:HAD-IA family hydrolase [Paenibacillus psychroresistens]|uniref:HAD-IA family hydrolase n=1 Tax=Paenibacillus psychroresistens TaxID=1778678 RepID=UPI001391E0D2|nr:HAD-IA family hydrolase [Paenibacillus psychroresistens]